MREVAMVPTHDIIASYQCPPVRLIYDTDLPFGAADERADEDLDLHAGVEVRICCHCSKNIAAGVVCTGEHHRVSSLVTHSSTMP
jgi:hypothetical protein